MTEDIRAAGERRIRAVTGGLTVLAVAASVGIATAVQKPTVQESPDPDDTGQTDVQTDIQPTPEAKQPKQPDVDEKKAAPDPDEDTDGWVDTTEREPQVRSGGS
jgi:hypothetical protein